MAKLEIDTDLVKLLWDKGYGSRRIAKELKCGRGCIKRLLESSNLRHPKRTANTLDSILSRVNKGSDNTCWEWQGDMNSGGYGIVSYDGKKNIVHRLIYKLMIGPVPSNLYVCHKCDNPPCCNPDHLFLGTNQENIIDCIKKSRMSRVKLNAAQVVEIRKKYESGVKRKELSGIFGVSITAIANIVKGLKWKFINE